VRHGRRAGRSTLVAHYLAPGPAGDRPARAGFVVGRTVGNSVVRHRTVRRLRHLVRDRLALLPPGARLVVRALPPAATADSAALSRDLDAALTRLRLADDGAKAAPGRSAATAAEGSAPAGPAPGVARMPARGAGQVPGVDLMPAGAGSSPAPAAVPADRAGSR
jgi:ribonuclease P protein component